MIRDQSSFDQLLDTLRRFVAERLVLNEARVAAEDRVPPELVAEMRALGLFGLAIPEEFGGLGLTMEEEALAAIEIGRTSPAFRSVFG
ncbi:acyl-CoA dehydrogenase family protein, partial [Salmonella enterica subsp. enterica serovar Minnesota]|uniref:acyl-CoA dehydrogenase family protein n=1 Tax=Salmonella enterica TaxID=28901 RepID=UPI003D27E483